jgi:hypothetical protein
VGTSSDAAIRKRGYMLTAFASVFGHLGPYRSLTLPWPVIGDQVEDWLVRHFTVSGVPFQNWMVVAFALIVIAVLKGERR